MARCEAARTGESVGGIPLGLQSAFDRRRVALDHTGEGQVTETEVGDEDSYHEVEVTLDDGRQVDVQLDEDFNVVGASADVGDADGEDND